MHRVLFIIGILMFAACMTGEAREPDRQSTQPQPPVAVFADLDGTWTGVFIGYDPTGKELYRINVRQTYKTIDDHTQKVTVTDTMPDGTIITGTGSNTARRNEDSTLTLNCVVDKSNGERVEHLGRLVVGPDSDTQIIWYSQASDRVETFRETVREQDGRKIYEINGMGRYGKQLILMHGRYYQLPKSK